MSRPLVWLVLSAFFHFASLYYLVATLLPYGLELGAPRTRSGEPCL